MWPIEISTVRKRINAFATLALIVSLGLSRDGKAQQDFVALTDIGFVATPSEGQPSGLHFATEEGPTGGPYQPSEFFQGVTSTEADGAIPLRDNTFGLCFNMSHCTPTRLIPNLHSFAWTWEAGYQPVGATSPYIENNVGVTYSDGTYHRPWAFHIFTAQKEAVLSFSSKPNQVNFHINQNGNVVIGPLFQQPIHQLEVVGSELVTQNVTVSGNMTVAGQPVVTGTGSASHGPLQWGVSDGVQLNSASAICAASQLGCQGAVLPNGTNATCSQPQPEGVLFFALCR
jgi:hypothetical protein